MTIYFDMDGTIADLYGVKNWLPALIAEDVAPYRDAKPLVNMQVLARYLNRCKKRGIKIGVISWGSKKASEKYLQAIEETKRNWLQRHLKSVQFDEVLILPYGTPKQNFCSNSGLDVLFDDEELNRQNWMLKGLAFNEKNIFPILKTFLANVTY